MPKQLSFAAAMRDFFGLKDGQTLQQFIGELKALDTADRVYFREQLATVGYEVTPDKAA